MSSIHCCRPQEPSHHGHRAMVIGAALALAIGLPLLLYAHGVRWWWSPAAFVLLHGIVTASLAFIVGHQVRAGRASPARAAADGHTCCDGSAAHREEQDALIHSPRMYDWFVRLLSLGREGRMRHWLLDLADLRTGDRVLDVGCGTGTLLLGAAERVGASGTLCGIEPAAEMAARARLKAVSRGVMAEVIEGSAQQLPFPDASFDVLFCTMVLHHLPESARTTAVGEMARVLKPGGRLVIADVRPPRSATVLFSLVSLAHLRAPHPLVEVSELEPTLAKLGLTIVQRRSRGAIAAIVVTRP